LQLIRSPESGNCRPDLFINVYNQNTCPPMVETFSEELRRTRNQKWS